MNGSSQNKIVVVSASPNDAERIESQLRNAGKAVHAQWIQNADDLPTHLPGTALVISSDLPRMKDVVALCQRLVPGVPILAVDESIELARVTNFLQMGARDLVSLQHMDHLLAVVLRELDHSQQVRALQEARNRLQQVEHRHDSLMQDTTEALAYVQEGIHIRVNPAYAKLFGFADSKAIEGLPLMDLVTVDDRPALKLQLRNSAKGKAGKDPMHFHGLTVEGKPLDVIMRFSLSHMDDEQCIEVLACRNETAKPAAAPAAAAAPTPDSAATYTGQHGRQSLYTDLEAALKSDTSIGMPAVLFVRVDNLERLEQRLGFIQADHIFNELAAYLLQWCGTNDRAYRFSVGEFVVLSTRDDLNLLEAAASELRTSTGKQVFGGTKNPTSVNVSIAVMPLVWHTDAQQILKEARQQILAVQESKGGGVFIETHHEKEKSGTPQQQDKLWLARIKTSLEQNRFRLIFKSIVSLEGETSQFFDVLLRMLNEQGDEIPALEFVPAAERHGLMSTIDQWVVQQSILSMARHPAGDQDFGLFVRVSDSAIDTADKFLPWLLKEIKGYPIRPESLILTFKEEGLQDHIAKAKPLIAGLRKLRMRVAISHFGGTAQSLQLLEQMPVDFLRLDEAIMKSLANPKSSERTSSMLRSAREKGARIIAKQVTDAQTMAMLWTLGVHFIEGDYLQDPSLASNPV